MLKVTSTLHRVRVFKPTIRRNERRVARLFLSVALARSRSTYLWCYTAPSWLECNTATSSSCNTTQTCRQTIECVRQTSVRATSFWRSIQINFSKLNVLLMINICKPCIAKSLFSTSIHSSLFYNCYNFPVEGYRAI